MYTAALIKIIVGVLFGYSILEQFTANQTWWFIQNVNLIFHEAGHIFLMFFGRTLQALGGSLFEVSIPLFIMLYFFAKRYYFSAAFGAWWLSTALLSVSIYIADAREQVLPLLGGNAVSHDWHVLLSGWGLLRYDDIFGYIIWILGFSCLVLIAYFIYRDKDVTLLLHKIFSNHETHLTQHRR